MVWIRRIESSISRLGMVTDACNPSYSGVRDSKISVEASLGELSIRPYLRNKPKKQKDQWYDSRSRMLA
jgi:hypothetical protein